MSPEDRSRIASEAAQKRWAGKEAPTSLRVPEDLETALVEFMAANAIKKRGTAIIALMRRSLDPPREPIVKEDPPAPRLTGSAQAKANLRHAEAEASQTAFQDATWKAINAKLKPQAVEPHIGKDGIAVGQVAQKPGSRLKQAPKGRDKWAR